GYSLDRRIETDNPNDYLLLWKDAAGNRQLVAWTAPPAGGTPDEARAHDVTIQTTPGGTFQLADVSGKTSTIDQLKLTLSAMPQYVALPAGVELGAIATAAPAPLVVAQGPAAEGLDLQLMADGDAWSFIKNTGEG